jgi:hypothetical protein
LLNPSGKKDRYYHRNTPDGEAFQIYVRSLSRNGLYVHDNYGRRSGLDRRQKVISKIKVERRIQGNRRKNIDRRIGIDRRLRDFNVKYDADRRSGIDRRQFMNVDLERTA